VSRSHRLGALHQLRDVGVVGIRSDRAHGRRADALAMLAREGLADRKSRRFGLDLWTMFSLTARGRVIVEQLLQDERNPA